METEVVITGTRMRRRLSVESDDVKSPATPLTPSKTRGGRLAVKPQLELIDENATENVPKRTRKSVDEKPMTPSRRSTRIKSNTSIVSETPSADASDEKTPARRSARVKSNTSLISSCFEYYDSPRAKRAARRNSQVGSDTEAPITPARQTRRTRKDSATSVDKAEINASKVINEVITEETETNVKETSPSKSNSSPRNSPRLKSKSDQKSSALSDINKNESPNKEAQSSNTLEKLEESTLPTTPKDISVKTTLNSEDLKQNDEMKSKDYDQKNLSINSIKLLELMDTSNKKFTLDLNKTTSIVIDEESKQYKSKRCRTKSYSHISSTPCNDGSCFSDSETVKKNNKRKRNNISIDNKLGAGDLLNTSVLINRVEEYDQSNDSLKSFEKAKKRLSKKTLTTDEPNIPNLDDITAEIVTENRKTVLDSSEKASLNKSEMLLKQAPSSFVRSVVYIEDSDSNTGSAGIENKEELFHGDQCVPVVEHQLEEEAPKQKNNVSCEPMDIDVTIPENTFSLIADKQTIDPSTESEVNENRKSSICIPKDNVSINKLLNESNGKSSGNTEILNLDNTENKSTLVLSQIKDLSTSELNDINASNTIVDTKGPLSISDNGSSTAKAIEKKQLSENYSTSTPLQQKSLKTLGIQLNTSIITPNNKNLKEKETKRKSENQTSVSAQNIDSSSESEVIEQDSEADSVKESKLIIDEAEEASDDYKSGDSRDEEEKLYEKENQIHDKGESLNSDDEQEYSDDSDYEKGSFIVSTDEEDHDLLSGTGDDLSSSADELSMSAKSKKKYNARKLKEQKKASKEMFQARHKLNKSDENTKSRHNLLDSPDSEEAAYRHKKINRRQRIDSGQDVSIDNSLLKKKKKTRRLSDSICEGNDISEKEMTIYEGDNNDKEDPLSVLCKIKEEPKTPQESLDISTVQVTNINEIEEIHVNENVSMTKVNETSDPLQATILHNGEEYYDDAESISENEEIAQNYDTLLNDLNNAKPKQIKLLDVSLNINKKPKQKTKEPVIDELNLTQTKKSKKNRIESLESSKNEPSELKIIDEPTEKEKCKTKTPSEDSSDSIDMKLLFPEESNDSGTSSAERKDTTKRDSDTNNKSDDFIPLKRTNANTNIPESIDNQNENDVSFFIDTMGTHVDEIDTAVLNKSSTKKNKNKRYSNLGANDTATDLDKTDLNCGDLQKKSDVDIVTSKKRLSVGNISLVDVEKEEHNFIDTYKTKEDSINNSAKKENKSSIGTEEGTIKKIKTPNNQSAKKKKNKEYEINNGEIQNDGNISLDISNNSDPDKNEISKVDNSFNTKHIITQTFEADISMKNSTKKAKKNSISSTNVAEIIDQTEDIEDVPENESDKKRKKKKRNENLTLESEKANEDGVFGSERMGQRKNKKNNKNKSDTSQTAVEETDGNVENTIAISLSNTKKAKKKSESNTNEEIDEECININKQEMSQKQNRKRKSSTTHTLEEIAINDDLEDLNNSATNERQKKKRKISSRDQEIVTQNQEFVEDTHEDTTNKKSKKKNRSKQNTDMIQSNDEFVEDTHEDTTNKKSKKKHRSKQNTDMIQSNDDDLEDLNNFATNDRHKKKREISSSNQEIVTQNQEFVEDTHEDITNKKSKKKNRSKQNTDIIRSNDDDLEDLNNSATNDRQKKKLKVSSSNQEIVTQNQEFVEDTHEDITNKKTKKKNRSKQNTDTIQNNDETREILRKRKARDDDDNDNISKIRKQHSFDKIHVPRLPANVLKQLDDISNKDVLETRKAKVISTTQFAVEESKKRKNKPSNYLEQSVYLNDILEEKKRKPFIKTPKVLPFLPTASTSDCGFTTKFRINVVPQEPQFVAQSNDARNFKHDYLHNKKMKKLGTFEKYKKQRNVKLSKF